MGPRDGLQNESRIVPTDVKARFIGNLAASRLTEIEVTSFVSPRWVPQLADAEELSSLLTLQPTYSALVPNRKGVERAMQSGYQRIALFTAASDTFCRRNINMSRDESLEVFGGVIKSFRLERGEGGFIRAYVSTAFECPFEGRISPEEVLKLAERLFGMGVDEVSLGDTIGVAGPTEVKQLGILMRRQTAFDKVAFHFHDTRGTAIANVAQALDLGTRIFDASAAGLGGCPFAPGAGGNLATEDLIYFLEREGVPVSAELLGVAAASSEVLSVLGRPPSAKAQVAALAQGGERQY